MPYAKPYASTGRRHLIHIDFETREPTEFEAENLAPVRIDLLADAHNFTVTVLAPEPALTQAREALAARFADDGVYGDAGRHAPLADTTIDAAETVRTLLAGVGRRIEVHDRREADALLRQARAREVSDEEDDSLTANPNARKTAAGHGLGYAVLAGIAGFGLGVAMTNELGTGLLIGGLAGAVTWLLMDRHEQVKAAAA